MRPAQCAHKFTDNSQAIVLAAQPPPPPPLLQFNAVARSSLCVSAYLLASSLAHPLATLAKLDPSSSRADSSMKIAYKLRKRMAVSERSLHARCSCQTKADLVGSTVERPFVCKSKRSALDNKSEDHVTCPRLRSANFRCYSSRSDQIAG